jgi:hypothetical protein
MTTKKTMLFVMLAIALIFLSSCKKDGGCYYCTFGSTNGYQRPPEIYCGQMPANFTDPAGNPIQYSCQPR